MSGRTVLLLTISLCLNFVAVRLKDCEQDPDSLCKCKFDDGGELDLTSLGNSDNTPRFKDVLSKGEGNYYSYNPCNPFQEKECKDAAACILNPDKSQSITIGDAEKAAFNYDDDTGNVIIGYTSGAIKDLRLTEVLLVCDESACEPEISADGQQDQGYFQLTLKTVCACPDGCSASGPKNCGDNGISGGTIICIIAISVLIMYFVIGILTMKFVKRKEGIEIIPNVTFWRTLPVLIKGGVLFSISKCRRRTSYDKI